jgi:hypothetical protein
VHVGAPIDRWRRVVVSVPCSVFHVAAVHRSSQDARRDQHVDQRVTDVGVETSEALHLIFLETQAWHFPILRLNQFQPSNHPRVIDRHVCSPVVASRMARCPTGMSRAAQFAGTNCEDLVAAGLRTEEIRASSAKIPARSWVT